jgi:hypothetical protein
MRSSAPAPSRLETQAKYAALIAPTEAPTTKSGRTPQDSRTRNMPTCIAPRLPPPAKTNAVVFLVLVTAKPSNA